MKKFSFIIFYFLSFSLFGQECVERIVVSRNAVTAFTEDRLYSWGANVEGVLGLNSDNPEPIAIPTILGSQWQDISHGPWHTLALNHDGTIWAWGHNEYGGLGNGTTDPSWEPIQIGNDTDWVAISAGRYSSLALKSNGTMWGWGSNHAYQLINSSTEIFNTPIQIDDATDWKYIEAAYFGTLAIKEDGTLWGRGRNINGALGVYANTAHFLHELTQIGTDTDWLRVSGGEGHTLAMKTDSTLWSWGEGASTGHGSITNNHIPMQLTNDKWKDFSAGSSNSLAVKSDGTLWEWNGLGFYTSAGLYPQTLTPTQVGNDNDWEKVGAGYYLYMAVKENKTLWAWGFNEVNYGNNSTEPSHSPVLSIPCGQMVNVEDVVLPQMVFYPNPAANKIEWTGETNYENYTLVNMLGQIVESGKLNASHLNISQLTPGMYILQLSNKAGNTTQHKFLKQ